MRKLIFLISLLAVMTAYAQTLPLSVIAPAGAQAQSGTYSLSYTLGEPAIQASVQGNINFNEGFWQQPTSFCVVPDTPKNVTPVANVSICRGKSTQIMVNAIGTVGWYTAASGGQYLGAGNTFTTPVLSTNTTYYAQDSTICGTSTGRRAITITVFQTSVSLGADQTVCPGKDAVLDAGVFKQYLWSEGSNKQSIVVNKVGAYTVTVTDDNGCTATSSVQVKNHTQPTTTIAGKLTFCPGKSTDLSAVGVFTAYQWSVSGQNNSSINISLPGIYSVTATDANSCTATATASVSIFPQPPTPVVGGETTVCKDGVATVYAKGAFSQYQWNVQGQNTDTLRNAPVGTYTVTATDANGCTASNSISVALGSMPPTSVNLLKEDISCAGDKDGRIIVTLVSGVSPPFQYSIDGSPWQSGNVFDKLPPGIYDVSARGANACEKVTEITILSKDSLKLSVKEDPLRRTDSTATMTGVVLNPQGALTWNWSGTGLSCKDCKEPVVMSTIPDYVYCTVTDAKGCSASARAYVLNTYTPPNKIDPPVDVLIGKDGKTDPFEFPDITKDPKRFEDNEFIVMNRWGQMVYRIKNYNNNWVGTNEQGQDLPEGTYYYVLTVQDKLKQKSVIHGNVLIIR